MTPPTSNARTLLMRIFEAWRADCLASYSEGAAFEIFASELVLRPYDLALNDVKAGIVGGGQDGAIDFVYVFFDDNLIAEDSEVIDPASKPEKGGEEKEGGRERGRSLHRRLWPGSATRASDYSNQDNPSLRRNYP